MKNIAFLLILFSFPLTISSQAPESFNYQAVLRNLDGTTKADESLEIQISILQGSIDGASVYMEIHNTSSNSLGLIQLDIGTGTTSDDFSAIYWSQGPYFLEITVNGTLMGTSQLLSVPFALYSEKSGDSFSGNYSDLSGTPKFSTVATSGNYSDLSG